MHELTCTNVTRWDDHLFSFKTTRPTSFRFNAGEFVMVGLANEGGKPTMRAYSIASAPYDDHLEFFSIIIPDGPLTSRLQHLQPGDTVLMGPKATGTLVLHTLKPGAKRLILIGTGTGLAPWLSIVQDPHTYEAFEKVIVSHTVREATDLAYRKWLEEDIVYNEVIGDQASDRLVYDPCTTRDPYSCCNWGRITDRIANGSFPAKLFEKPLDPETDRIMLCGSTAMLRETSDLLEKKGFSEGALSHQGTYVIERAFAG